MKLALLSLMFLLLMGIAMGEDSIMLDLPPGMSPDEAGETVQKSIEQNIETDGDLPEKTIVKPTTGPVSTFQGEGEFSHNDGVTNIETINTLETTSNENLADATNVEITKDGSITAETAESFGSSTFTLSDLEQFEFKDNIFSINKATKLSFTKPYPISFDEVGPSSFEVVDGSLIRWDVTFPRAHAYTWKNPMISIVNDGLVGSAVSQPVVDGFWQARGDEEDSFKGDNSFYNGNRPGSNITLELTNNASFMIGGSGVKIFETTILEDEPARVSIIKSEAYHINTLNTVTYFYGNEFVERIKAHLQSFSLDVNEGVYEALLFTEGTYRFSFRNLKKYQEIFALKQYKHWAQSFEIEHENPFYTLWIDKIKRRAFKEQFTIQFQENAGFISMFNNHELLLKGKVDYKRKGFQIGDVQVQSGKNIFYQLEKPEVKYYPIIENIDKNTETHIVLEDNVFADVTIEGDYKAHFEDAIIEQINNKQILNWEIRNPPALRSLRVDPHELLQVEDIAGARILTAGNAKFYSELDNSVKVFVEAADAYDKAFPFCTEVVTPEYFKDINGLDNTLRNWASQ